MIYHSSSGAVLFRYITGRCLLYQQSESTTFCSMLEIKKQPKTSFAIKLISLFLHIFAFDADTCDAFLRGVMQRNNPVFVWSSWTRFFVLCHSCHLPSRAKEDSTPTSRRGRQRANRGGERTTRGNNKQLCTGFTN